jgi:hypothetical protein
MMARLFLCLAVATALCAVSCSSPSIHVGPLPNVAAVRSSNTETRAHIKKTQEHIENVASDLTELHSSLGPGHWSLLLDHAQSELAFAKEAAAQSAATAEMTDRRALVAEKAVADEHTELKRCANENAAMRPIVNTVNKWWGIGGIVYGFVRLAKHLLILAAVVIAIGVAVLVLSFFFPVIGVAFKAIGPLFGAAMSRVTGIFRRK